MEKDNFNNKKRQIDLNGKKQHVDWMEILKR